MFLLIWLDTFFYKKNLFKQKKNIINNIAVRFLLGLVKTTFKEKKTIILLIRFLEPNIEVVYNSLVTTVHQTSFNTLLA